MSERLFAWSVTGSVLRAALVGSGMVASGCSLSVIADLEERGDEVDGPGNKDASTPDDDDDSSVDPPPVGEDGGRDGSTAMTMDGGSDSSVAMPTDSGQPDTSTGEPEDAGCVPVVPTDHRRVFVTSELFAGPLTSLGTMDFNCQILAESQCLGGDWKVWLSDSANTPKSRFTKLPAMPYKRLDGVTVANSWADLVDGALLAPISITERKEMASGEVWTATNFAGNAFTGFTCEDWQSSSSSLTAKDGSCTSKDSGWTHGTDRPCSDMARVYCFEQ